MTTIIRRRKLGMSSVKGICNFSRTGMSWVRSDRPLPRDAVYVRWGCTADVPADVVINKAKAIHEVNDKRGFRAKLDDHDLCPRTWFDVDAVPEEEFINGVILRPAHHAQGRRLWKLHSRAQLAKQCIGIGDYYISSYIAKEREYRVFVVQGRAVCVAEKTPDNPNAIAWNVAKGGRFDNVRWDNWPLKAVRVAIEGFNLSSLDFGGVDVMVAGGECYILEINSAPSLTSPYRQQCMARGLDYLVTEGRERIPLAEERGGYKKFIHPAVCERAILKEVA